MSASISRLINGLLHVLKLSSALWYLAEFFPIHGRYALMPCNPPLAAWRHILVVGKTVQQPRVLLADATVPFSCSTLHPSDLFSAHGLHRWFHFLCLSFILLMNWLSRKVCCCFPWRILQAIQLLLFHPNLIWQMTLTEIKKVCRMGSQHHEMIECFLVVRICLLPHW